MGGEGGRLVGESGGGLGLGGFGLGLFVAADARSMPALCPHFGCETLSVDGVFALGFFWASGFALGFELSSRYVAVLIALAQL